jgi:hypothetical protein
MSTDECGYQAAEDESDDTYDQSNAVGVPE